MINVEIKSNIKFPQFTHEEDLAHIAEKIFIPWMEDGIDRGVDLLGGSFPPNEPATIKAKGHNRPLIGKERKLRKSFISFKRDKDEVVITLLADRLDIGKYLQLEGIKSKMGLKIYNFFGINKLMENSAMAYIRKRIGEAINA